MQRIQPYTFSFLQWESDKFKGTHQVRTIRGVMVTMETTRSGKTVFRTRTNWDNAASAQFEVANLEAEEDGIVRSGDRMQQCHYFWNCMRYAVVRCLVDEVCIDEFINPDNTDAWTKVCEALGDGPKPTDPPTNYLARLQTAFPALRLEVIDNGFTGAHDWSWG